MLMTVDGAQRHPVLGPIIKDNPQVFDEEHKGDWEQLTLVTFIIYEFSKGADSFWKPYLDLMPFVRFFCHWSKDLINATQDPRLILDSLDYKDELALEWLELRDVLRKYPEVFPESVVNSDLFYKFYAQVCTRCFGWGLPSTSMIPMADNCNHSDVTVVQEIINTKMHPFGDPGSKYFTKTKYMNDYSLQFDDQEEEFKGQQLVNIKGRFNRANYEANKQFTKLDKIKAAI